MSASTATVMTCGSFVLKKAITSSAKTKPTIASSVMALVESSIVVKPSYGLTDEDVISMLQDGTASAKSDMLERELREQRVEAMRLIESTNSALAEDADLLSAEERALIDAGIARLEAAAKTEDAEAIKAAIAELTKDTGEFAARRMDRSIREALSGRSVDSVIE